jgi:hypothetical protein
LLRALGFAFAVVRPTFSRRAGLSSSAPFTCEAEVERGTYRPVGCLSSERGDVFNDDEESHED